MVRGELESEKASHLGNIDLQGKGELFDTRVNTFVLEYGGGLEKTEEKIRKKDTRKRVTISGVSKSGLNVYHV